MPATPEEKSWTSVLLNIVGIFIFGAAIVAFYDWGVPAIRAIEWSSAPDSGKYSIAQRGLDVVRIDTATGETWIMYNNTNYWVPTTSTVKPSSTYMDRYREHVKAREEKQRRNREESEAKHKK